MGRYALTGNITANNITIDKGVFLTTNGYYMIAKYNFVNYGTINAGHNPYYMNLISSYGASGGGAQSSAFTPGTYGFSTRVRAGAAGIQSSGKNGSTPTLPSNLTQSNISQWLSAGIQNYISGAAGENFTKASYPYYGGLGSYGVYIYASNLEAGNINASGGRDTNIQGGGIPGSGGGGVIVLEYENTYVKGVYNVSGGEGVQALYYSNLYSGSGGNGSVIVLKVKAHIAETANYNLYIIIGIVAALIVIALVIYEKKLRGKSHRSIEKDNFKPESKVNSKELEEKKEHLKYLLDSN